MRIVALVVCLMAGSAAAQQNVPNVSPLAALNHIGERAEVCGKVASANFTASKSVVLAIDYPAPAQTFSLLIQAIDRAKFGAPELSLLGKRVCANGVLLLDQGRAQIIVRDPNQITFQ